MAKPKYGQRDVVVHLRKARTSQEVEEVLASYLWAGLGQTVRSNETVFTTMASLAAASIPVEHVVAAATPVGLEAWNRARRGWKISPSPASSAASTPAQSPSPDREDDGFFPPMPAGPDGRAVGSPWRAYMPNRGAPSPAFLDASAGYVDRDGDEGRRRVQIEDDRLPSYGS
ncbi:uncharacterized protein JCM10292_001700 [Rhodotorula paludigena]|uniref:uncharacterized protein n=1 Tax=Rhodotorula paludigena TaxID=86838 RepID=UPI00316FBF3F